MRVVGFDTETYPIGFVHKQDGKLIGTSMLAPRLVCGSWAEGGQSGLLGANQTIGWLGLRLRQENVLIVGHNIAYDLGVCAAEDASLLPIIFDALAVGRISDTLIRDKLICIAQGLVTAGGKEMLATEEGLKPVAFHLASLSERRLGETLAKEGTWRVRYHELAHVPIDQWPEEARAYPIKDAVTTLRVWNVQAEKFNNLLDNEPDQVRAAFALHLISLWGMRTDPVAVKALKDRLTKEQADALAALVPTGLVRANGSKDTKKIQALVQQCLGDSTPLTDKKEEPQIGEEVLERTGHPDLVKLARSMSGSKLLSTYVPVLEARSRGRLGCRYDSLKATGRTSSSGPNDQNPPRENGIRDCYVPEPGYVYVAADFDTLELRAWAQACLDICGISEMASALRRGEDLHVSLAAEILGLSTAEATRRYKAGDPELITWRQNAKPGNFGFPGGMSARTYVDYCASQGLKLSLDVAEKVREGWRRRWSEHVPYFDHVNRILSEGSTVKQLRSNRYRGNLSFCEAANTYFQGLAADGAKEALFRVTRECYADTYDPQAVSFAYGNAVLSNPNVTRAMVERAARSPLYGSRPVLFMHDEIMLESPEHRAYEAAERLAQVMIEGMAKFIPDVPITASPVIMRRWYKGAKPVRVNGRLVPSRPEKVGDKTVWVADLLQEVAA